MAERDGADNTSGLTEGDGLLRDVLQGVAVAGLAQHAVLDLLAGGHGGACSSGVGDLVVLDVVVVGPGLLRVVGTAFREGGHGQALEVLEGLHGLAVELLDLAVECALNQVLGLAGLVEVGGRNVVVTHAVTNHVDDVLRAAGRSLSGGDNASGGDGGDSDCRKQRTATPLEKRLAVLNAGRRLGHLQRGHAGAALVRGIQGNLAGLAVLLDGDGALLVGRQPVANEAVVERRRVFVDQLISLVIRDGDVDVFLAELTGAGGQGVVEAVVRTGEVRRNGEVELVLWQRQGGLALFSSEDELVRAH